MSPPKLADPASAPGVSSTRPAFGRRRVPALSLSPIHLLETRVVVVAGEQDTSVQQATQRLRGALQGRCGVLQGRFGKFASPDAAVAVFQEKDIVVFVTGEQERERLEFWRGLIKRGNRQAYIVFAGTQPAAVHAELADAVINTAALADPDSSPERMLQSMLKNPPRGGV